MTPGDAVLANKAAEEVAAYENQFATMRIELAGIRGEQNLMKWMLDTVLAIVLAIALKLFIH